MMKPAQLARSFLRLITRVGSPKSQAHHASYLEDIFEHEPPVGLRHEARASMQHLVSALGSREPTSMLIVCGAALMCVGLVGVALAPTTSIAVEDPLQGVIAQAAHLVGAAGIAATFVSGRTHARQVFIWLGIIPTLIGQVCNLTVTYPYVDRVVSAADCVLWWAEAVGAVASVALLVTLFRGQRHAMQTSWRALCTSFMLIIGAHCVYALAFARMGDVLWAALICAAIWGNASFVAGLSRHRPVWWTGAS